jgi:hypothetical protein
MGCKESREIKVNFSEFLHFKIKLTNNMTLFNFKVEVASRSGGDDVRTIKIIKPEILVGEKEEKELKALDVFYDVEEVKVVSVLIEYSKSHNKESYLVSKSYQHSFDVDLNESVKGTCTSSQISLLLNEIDEISLNQQHSRKFLFENTMETIKASGPIPKYEVYLKKVILMSLDFLEYYIFKCFSNCHRERKATCCSCSYKKSC